jgi:hypothetical protein
VEDTEEGPRVLHIPATDMLEHHPVDGHAPLSYARFRRVVTGIEGEDPITLIYRIVAGDAGVTVQIFTDAGGGSQVRAASASPVPGQAVPGSLLEMGNYVMLSQITIPGADELRVIKFRYSEKPFRPYFIDLAELSAAYWRASAMYVNALSFAGYNIIWGTGFPDDLSVVDIGPHVLIKLAEGGTLGALQGGGAGIDAARQDMMDLQADMDKLAATPMQADGLKTATEVSRDATATDSPIKRLAEMRIKGVREIMRYAAILMGLPDELEVYDVIGETDFNPMQATGAEAGPILNAYAVGLLDKETARAGLVRALVSLDGIDPADIEDREEDDGMPAPMGGAGKQGGNEREASDE